MKVWLLLWKLLLLQSLTLIVLALNFLWEMAVNDIQSSRVSDYQCLGRDLLHLKTKIKSVPPQKIIKNQNTGHQDLLGIPCICRVCLYAERESCLLLPSQTHRKHSFCGYEPFCCNSPHIGGGRISSKKKWKSLYAPTLIYPSGFP